MECNSDGTTVSVLTFLGIEGGYCHHWGGVITKNGFNCFPGFDYYLISVKRKILHCHPTILLNST